MFSSISKFTHQGDELEKLKRKAVWSDSYSLFGVDYTLNFDSKGTYKYFNYAYKHFKVNSFIEHDNYCNNYYIISNPNISSYPLLIVESEKAPPLSEVFSKGNNRKRFKPEKLSTNGSDYYIMPDIFLGDRPSVMLNGKVSAILDPESWKAYAELLIFHSIISQIPNHFLLHAGVVSYRNKGIILCGDMNSGKSILTLGLVTNGFKFLSDEFAFVDLENFEVAPFPRVLGLREVSVSKIPELKLSVEVIIEKSLAGDMKWLLDVENISPNSLGKRCKIGCLIILDGFGDAPELKPISRADAIFESLKYTHTLEDDPFGHILKVADLFNDNDIVCCKLVLGDREDNLRVLNRLFGEIF